MNQSLLENYQGKLLIAHPKLPIGHPFKETVIYITQDQGNATIGVILNVNSITTVQRICNEQGILFTDGRPTIYKGGPINSTSLLMLHSDEWNSQHTLEAGHSYAVSSDTFMFEKLESGNYPVYYRIFAGITAWQPGQLSAELTSRGPYTGSLAWLLATPNDDIIFGSHGPEQYQNALDLCSQQTFDQYF
jgi:putative transcriptional regulator